MTALIQRSWTDQADARLVDMDLFDAWFDAASTRRETIANGTIDFYHRIFTPDLYPLIGDPRDKTCLEVGHGGGRLLDAALDVFARGYGIDVLSPAAVGVIKERMRHRNLVTLVHRDNVDDIPSNSIDFVYSFIVFQHFDGFDEVKRYLTTFARVMKPGAVGKVFYAPGQATSLHVDSFSDNPRAETLTVWWPDMERAVKASSLTVWNHGPAGPKKVWNPTGAQSSQVVIVFTKQVERG